MSLPGAVMEMVLICLGIGCAMGLFSGLLGVGGGIIAVPAMVYFLKMDLREATGTSLAIIVPVALSGSFKHVMQDNVRMKAGLCIAVSGIVMAYVGAWLNGKIDPMMLKRAFAVFMIIVAVKMLWEGAPPAAVAK